MPRAEEWDWPPPRRSRPPQTIDFVRVTPKRSCWRIDPNKAVDLFGRTVFETLKILLILALGCILAASFWFIGAVIRA